MTQHEVRHEQEFLSGYERVKPNKLSRTVTLNDVEVKSDKWEAGSMIETHELDYGQWL